MRIVIIIMLFLAIAILFLAYKQNAFIEKLNASCLGARDGISGCRDCCRNKKDYNNCVNSCMNYLSK
jgi:hypothetical protein